MNRLTLFSVAVAMSALSAQAELIDVNFYSAAYGGSAASGPAVVGSHGDIWNGIDADGGLGAAIPLVDSTGSATSATLSYSSVGAVHSAAPNNQPNASLMYDYTYTYTYTPLPITVTVDGLAPDTTYDLYVYLASNDANSGHRAAAVFANSVSGSATGNPESSFINGQNYLLLTPETSALGDLTITESPTVFEADMNGFQLSLGAAVPDEASTFWLMGLGVLGLLIVRQISAKGSPMIRQAASSRM